MTRHARSQRLRAPLVVTVASAFLAAHCDAPKEAATADASRPDGARFDGTTIDAPPCPPRATLPDNLACLVNGQECEMRVHGQWCPDSFAVPWHCEDHVWRDYGSWSCNPPAPTDVPRPPSPDRPGVCPDRRPTDGASCEPADVPDRCYYPALDPVCPAEQPDVATCPYPTGRWRVELTVCRRSPCPATVPPAGTPCEPPARDDCVYMAPCEGASVEVRAFCVASSREWVTRSLCRSWGGDASVMFDGR